MLTYQGILLIYMDTNLHAATVFASNGSDISISYSLKLNRDPSVIKNVNTKASKLITKAHITGAESMMPKDPNPMVLLKARIAEKTSPKSLAKKTNLKTNSQKIKSLKKTMELYIF